VIDDERPEEPETPSGEEGESAVPEGSAEPPPAGEREAPEGSATEGGEPEPAAEEPGSAAESEAAAEPEQPPAGPAAEAPAEPEPPQAPAPAEPEAPEAPAQAEPTAEEPEELEETPREKPEIPGADLEPDIISEAERPEIPGADLEPTYIPPEAEEFLDPEAQAAAEAEAEAATSDAEEPEVESQPIADAAIDLAAGARYTATGKRKTAVARVILKPGGGNYLINEKPLDTFFPRETLRRMIRQPLEAVGYDARMDVVARMHGGGVSAQAGALRHGISRALIVADPHLRGELKRRGFLTRDPRVKERKKAGLKKARKRPQFSKR
jgi:small subunit ribosomal protein S9